MPDTFDPILCMTGTQSLKADFEVEVVPASNGSGSMKDQIAKRRYGGIMVFWGVATFLGLLPAIVVKMFTGRWYANAWKYMSGQDVGAGSAPYQIMITVHAVTGIILLALLLAQVVTGLWGDRDSRRKQFHRFVGAWLILPICVPSIAAMIASQVTEAITYGSTAVYLQVPAALVILAEIIFGVYCAKKKRIDEHKDMMMWAILDMGSSGGIARCCVYLLQPLFSCDVFKSEWPFVLAVLTAFIGAVSILYPIGRIGRQYKINSLLLAVHVLLLIFGLLSAFTFSCDDHMGFRNATNSIP